MCLPRAVSEAPPVFAGVPTAAGRPSTTPSNPAKSRRGGTAQVMPAPAAPPRGVPRQPRAHAPPPPPPPRTVLYARSLKVGEGMRAASVAAALLACACAVALASGASGAAVPCQAYLTTPSARVGTGGATEGGRLPLCVSRLQGQGALHAPPPARHAGRPPHLVVPIPPPHPASPPNPPPGDTLASIALKVWRGGGVPPAWMPARLVCARGVCDSNNTHPARPPTPPTPPPPPRPPTPSSPPLSRH